jgi:hypothetical protein
MYTANDALKNLASGRLPLAEYIKQSMALEASGLADRDVAGLRKTLLDRIARFAYVLAWDAENENRLSANELSSDLTERARARRAVHIPGGSQVEDFVPKRTPASAREYARGLVEKIEKKNNVPIEILFLKAIDADGGYEASRKDEIDFASDLTFMANGHGVSWFDDHEEFDMEVPNYEYYL